MKGLQGVHHIAIICNDYAASKRFYCDVIGCEIIAEHYRAERNSYKLDLAIPGGGQIELFSFANPPPRPSSPEAQGMRHLAFRVRDIDACVEELAQLGIEAEPIRIDPYTHKRFTFFKDPDDLPLELYET